MKNYKDKNGNFISFEDDGSQDHLITSEMVEVTKEEFDLLLKENIVDLKNIKKQDINAICEAEIIGGFKSEALGSEHIYQSTEADQTNLMAMIVADEDDYFKCGVEDENGVITWSYEMHTVAQFKQVHKEGKDLIKNLLMKAQALKVAVADATTVEEVEAIQW